MLKKYLLVLLVLVVLLPACAANDNTTINETKSAASETVDTSPQRFTPNLPQIDLGGYEFRALIPEDNIYGTFQFSASEETGDTVNDSIYRRNIYVEEKYNVVFKETACENYQEPTGLFEKSVLAGSDDFDISTQLDWIYQTIKGYVLPADKLPYLDLTQPWYFRDYTNTFSVANKIFAVFSDECASVYDAIQPLYFNKKLITDYNMDNLYDLVNSGAWTYDKFFNMSRDASNDIDGDGIMTDLDHYGILAVRDGFLIEFWVCAGVQTVIKDSDDLLILNVDGNEKLFGILEKVRQNLYGADKIWFAPGQEKVSNYFGDVYDVSRQQFENNQGLFLSERVRSIPLLRSMDADFGIIPFPKADENQSRYYVHTNGGWPKVVPAHASNPERTSIIIEALAAESRNTTVPALKEVALKTKFARDNESAEMLDLIFDNVFVDWGMAFWREVRNPIYDETAGKGNYASMVASKSAGMEKALNDMNEAVINLK